MRATDVTDKRTARVPVMSRKDEVEAVDSFRFAERCPSRSKAIRLLMQRGLQASRDRTEKA